MNLKVKTLKTRHNCKSHCFDEQLEWLKLEML